MYYEKANNIIAVPIEINFFYKQNCNNILFRVKNFDPVPLTSQLILQQLTFALWSVCPLVLTGHCRSHSP